MKPINEFYQKQANTIIKKLEQRNMKGYFFHTAIEAKQKAIDLMAENSSISWGGSETLKEIGIFDELNKLNYKLYDRSNAKTPEETREMYLKALNVDYYLMSTNAITLDGKLVNIDGNGNRVAALIYGPKNIIIIAGMNKVVKDEANAIERIRNIAAPPNTIRLNINTPCSTSGKCHDCTQEQTICCQTVTTRFSRIPNRIKVILVGEVLGF